MVLALWFGQVSHQCLGDLANYVVLGCPDCQGNQCEPRVSYRCSLEVRSFIDLLLGEVIEFMDDSVCAEQVPFEGGRQSVHEALQELTESFACYGIGILPKAVDAKAFCPSSCGGSCGHSHQCGNRIAGRLVATKSAGEIPQPCCSTGS